MARSSRPLGVTVVALLEIASAIITGIVGTLLVVWSAFFQSILPIPSLTGILIGIGGALLAVGVFSLVLGFALLRGKGWARSIALALSVLGLVTGGISLVFSMSLGIASVGGTVIGLLVHLLIVYYLTRPSVEAYFTWSRTREYQAFPPQSVWTSPRYAAAQTVDTPVDTTSTVYCPICKNTLGYVEQYRRWYCYHCNRYM